MGGALPECLIDPNACDGSLSGVFALVSEKLVRDLEPVLDTMDEEVDELDDLIFHGEASEMRERLKQLRRRSAQLRRYLAPQCDTLNRIEHDDAPWLKERDKQRFREVIDKLMRFIEYLDAIDKPHQTIKASRMMQSFRLTTGSVSDSIFDQARSPVSSHRTSSGESRTAEAARL